MNAPPALERPPTSVWSMYRSIVGVGALCALLIVSVFNGTQARIADNRAKALALAINSVLPAARFTVPVTLNERGELAQGEDQTGLPVFLAYNNDNQLMGAAVTAIGMGYQDNIRVLYAYSFDRSAITGFKVLESKETPGLGDRVEIEPHFIANFEALDASLNDARDALANPIVPVKQGEKLNAWEVDGITGATITSFAIGHLLNESANRWVPVLERDKAPFAVGNPEAQN